MNDIQQEIITPLRKEREEKVKVQKENKDYFATVTVCQTVICVLLFFVVLFISKGTGEMSASLKEDYKKMIEWSFENTDAESVMKMINSYLKEPVNLMPAFTPDEEEETKADEEEASSENETTLTESEEENTAAKEVTENMGRKELEPEAVTQKLSVAAASSLKDAVSPVESAEYTSYFGKRISPITGKESFHTGLDIAAPMGENVKASYSGRVRKTGEDERSGKYVAVTHSESLETLYCHLSEILTEEGERVRAGDVIGLVGSTGWSTGPHLHFEVRRDGESIDPLTVLKNDV